MGRNCTFFTIAQWMALVVGLCEEVFEKVDGAVDVVVVNKVAQPLQGWVGLGAVQERSWHQSCIRAL